MEDVKSISTLSRTNGVLEEEGYQMYLGEGCRLTGVLKVQGRIRIDGFVEGEVFGSDLIQVGVEEIFFPMLKIDCGLNAIESVEGIITAE